MNKKKIINILTQFSIFTLSLVLFLVARLATPATDLDEVWNYNTANAFALFLCCERSSWHSTTIPVGICVIRTAESVVLTC